MEYQLSGIFQKYLDQLSITYFIGGLWKACIFRFSGLGVDGIE